MVKKIYIGESIVQLTNIIPDGNMESSSWSGGNYSTTEKLFGTRSQYFPANSTTVQTISTPTMPVVGHKYYGRHYLKTDGNVTAADCRFEWYAGDGPGLNYVFGWNQGNYPNWTMESSIVTVDAVNGSSYVCRSFDVNNTGAVWADGLMIVDLTEAFGSGNEPTKQWCDENIPFFNESTEIFNTYNSNLNSVAVQFKKGYIGINNIARKIVKGYIGINNIARLWYNILWVWDVYQYGYNPVEGTSLSEKTSSAFYAGTSYTLNQNTGQFSVDQTTQIAKSSSGASNAVGKYLINLASSSGTKTGSTVYLITAASYNWLTGLSLTLTPITAQIYRGTLVGTTVDLDGTAYPADGVQDGYWYVLRDLPAISYSGNLIKRIALMEDVYYLLLEVTSSGTLTADVAVAADVWICGGGGGGYYAYGHGGAGAYAASANNVSIQDLVITIGSGDADNVSAGGSSSGVGGTTTITGDLSLSAAGGSCGGRVIQDAGGNNVTVRGSGGTGGGKGGLRKKYSGECTGDGLSKIPFNDNYFNSYCDGGGGGWGADGYDGDHGGDGGTNGGGGATTSTLVGNGRLGGRGGGLYGGNGGSGNGSGLSTIGENAKGYGSGGGGGSYDADWTGWPRTCGAGYQGVCFIRIPLE